jgi:hypothetical protein
MTELVKLKTQRSTDIYIHVIPKKYECLYPYIQKPEVSVGQKPIGKTTIP